MTTQILGLDRLKRKLSGEFMQKPMRKFFTSAAIAVQSGAKERAPVDTGRMRSSLTYEIDPAAMPAWAKVGTNVSYAPFMEWGTGSLSESPASTSGWHAPTGAALAVWARRHGTDGYIVAAAIAKRGGLKPRRFLRGSFEANKDNIKRMLRTAGREVSEAWNNGN
jgi:phage gpG-like protein